MLGYTAFKLASSLSSTPLDAQSSLTITAECDEFDFDGVDDSFHEFVSNVDDFLDKED